MNTDSFAAKKHKGRKDFGLRWQAQRDTALVAAMPRRDSFQPKSAVAAALCRRTP
jgi:hypothetical protein